MNQAATSSVGGDGATSRWGAQQTVLARYFDAFGEPVATLDAISPSEHLNRLLRIALGINGDMAVTFRELVEPADSK
jgi:hypothetical protein